MSIHVQLERFEGPLGLLLHLIREQEMDVFNINVHEITRQYLEYIKTMRRLDLEVAGEFVAMAATLIHIKSRTLLPQYNEEGEEIKEDPRKELVQKLVEYKRFQELSGELYKRPLLGRDVLARAERETFKPVTESELVLAENPLFSLISAYRAAVKNMKQGVHKVASELQSIAARILEMKDLLVIGKRILFRDLLNPSADIKGNHVLVTFLSLLELAKMGFVSVFQNEPLSDIHVEPKQAVDGDIVSRVESYDSVNAAAVVESILSDAQLSLNEPSAATEDDTEAPIVQEAYGDAASDDDIAAEEALLFADAPSDQLSDPADANLTTFVDFVASDTTEAAPDAVEAAGAESRTQNWNSDLAAELKRRSDVAADDEGRAEPTVPFADPEAVGEAVETVTMEAAAIPVADALAALSTTPADVPSAALTTADEVVQSTASPAPDAAPETQAQKVGSALSAALSAFDAFEEIASQYPDRPPEVES